MGNLDLLSCARTGSGYHDNAWELGECGYPDVFVRWNTRSNMDFVLRLISEGKLDVSGLISHKMPLSKIDDAVTMHIEHQDKTMGTVLMMDEDAG